MEFGDFLAFQQSLCLLSKPFDAPIEQIHVIVTFFIEFRCVLHSKTLVEMVHYDDFVFFVLVVIQFRKEFVSLDVRPWVVQGLSNMEFFVLFWFSQVE